MRSMIDDLSESSRPHPAGGTKAPTERTVRWLFGGRPRLRAPKVPPSEGVASATPARNKRYTNRPAGAGTAWDHERPEDRRTRTFWEAVGAVEMPRDATGASYALRHMSGVVLIRCVGSVDKSARCSRPHHAGWSVRNAQQTTTRPTCEGDVGGFRRLARS